MLSCNKIYIISDIPNIIVSFLHVGRRVPEGGGGVRGFKHPPFDRENGLFCLSERLVM